MARPTNGGVPAQKNWTETEARAVLDAWKKSGQSGAEYARSVGVVPQRLFWWRRRLGRGGGAAPAFAPVVATTLEPIGAALVVTTVDGARIDVHEVDGSTAAWVVAVLGGRVAG